MNIKNTVKVHNITKIYKLYKKPFDRVKESLFPSSRVYHKKFYALDNFSLEVKKGEALGVIGRNGNGKSTLLKIISGILSPTKGYVETYGKISAILELTSNLKQEMTGRENIIYNLRLQGFSSKQSIKEKIKEIENFAEIGEFIEQPVKTYSSGMKSRLGFAIATSVEPDILILDEVLAVGDFNFQQKCLAKINSMRDNISMIFVSHSMNSVRLFCDTVLVLEKGKKAFYGKAEDGIKYYLEQEEKKKKILKAKEIKKSSKPFYGDLFHNEEKISNVSFNWINEKNELINKCKTYDNIGIEFEFELLHKAKNLIIGLPFYTIDGDYISGISNEMTNQKLLPYKDNKYKIRFIFKNIFNPQKYIHVITIQDGSEFLYRNISNELEVFNQNRYFGYVSIEHNWIIK
ncbi:MAG: ABC transporter ATP-binding protein [bacterium]